VINPVAQFFSFRPATAIRVTGEDAFSFLQGQFTNDLRQAAGSVTYGLWLNQKGKVLADSHVLRIADNEFLLVSNTSSAAVLSQRLEQYIIADEVFVSDQSNGFWSVGLWGEGSGVLLEALVGVRPVAGQFLIHEGLQIFWGRRTIGENFECIGSESVIRVWREKLIARGGVEASAEAAELSRINSAIPAIPADIGPTDLPNEAGLETTAISYTKGCYLGQEVMARLKNLGQVRRQLRLVRGSIAAPKPGTPLFQATKKVGEVRSVAGTTDGFAALAMLTRMGLDENAGFTFEATDQLQPAATVWVS
jgi:tRNA-modifying protein YgfZ